MDSDVFNDGVRSGHLKARQETGPATHMIPLKRISLGPAGQSSTKISRKSFVNMLNHIHFMERHAYARVIYTLTGEEFLVRVSPDPCVKSEVRFSLDPDNRISPEGLQVVSLVVDDGKMAMIMPVKQVRQSGHSFTAVMGESGLVYSERQTKRFHCRLVDARIEDDAVSLTGRLLDFSANSLKVWIDEDQGPLYGMTGDGRELDISLHMLGQVVFRGRCKSIRTEDDGRALILLPINTHLARFKVRKLRNPRLNLVPTPKATFIHPLSGKRVTYEISDITTSGFSITEDQDTTELITGLIIPEITILFAGGFKMTCAAQIVYALKQKRKQCRFGFAIYDMDIVTYNQLFDVYSNAIDRHANVSREVDMDALWEFFFRSGFIYPEKYACLSQYREAFKDTYEKLYHGSQEIFANFTYQHNGEVFGHVSIIKAYERTWMIHHLAATPMGRKRTGLYVLNHILNYFDGLYRMPSIGMDHMIFYFRPENKFPNFFFGGFCRQLKQPKGCSMDCFAYLTGLHGVQDTAIPPGWTLMECMPEDFSFLRRYYEEVSGGLMIDAFCIDQPHSPGTGIEQLYGQYGLKRRSAPFVLKEQGVPRAFFIVDESDIGVNLSELLNSIKVVVVDTRALPWNTLQAALSRLVGVYGLDQVPIMVYPVSYMEGQGIRYDKKYNLWVLHSSYGDDYTEHLKDMAKINIVKMLFKYLLSRIRKS